jgi:phospholipase C
MAANHINIQHPEPRGINSDLYRQTLAEKKLRVELEQLTAWYRAITDDLTAIFNRIEAGEPCELHYPDGRVFQITGKEQ